MHRTLRWAAATAATGVVLVVATHSAGTAAGTPPSEPSCEVAQQQARDLADRYELAASQWSAATQSVMASAERAQQRPTPAQEGEVDRLQRVLAERALAMDAYTLASPRCFDADDVEVARQSVQQAAPRLAGV